MSERSAPAPPGPTSRAATTGLGRKAKVAGQTGRQWWRGGKAAPRSGAERANGREAARKEGGAAKRRGRKAAPRSGAERANGVAE
jgi:hypothetical protein